MNKLIPLIFVGALATACSDNGHWTLTGSVPSGTAMVVVEEPTVVGGWHAIDSVKPDKAGNFTLKTSPAKGSIYRVAADSLTAYVPADSTETITIHISESGITTLSGSSEATLFAKVDSIISNTPAPEVTHQLMKALDGNFASLAAYYATRRTSGPTLHRTVTNRHLEELPDNPRTSVLAMEFERNRAKNTSSEAQQVIISAPETSYFDIELMDRTGSMRKLSATVDSAKIAVLAFVDFSADNAQAVNMQLGEAHNRGAAIYEVGFAENQHLWENATKALPWVTVYQSETSPRNHLQQYVVSSLPTVFLFKNGEITERVTDLTKLKDIVSK